MNNFEKKLPDESCRHCGGKLIEAKKFVNVINHKFTNNKEAFEFMKTIAENKKDRDGEAPKPQNPK